LSVKMKNIPFNLSICFVAHNAYGALTGKDTGHVGGIEHQQALMSQWFAKRGYTVSMITWDENQVDGTNVKGVHIFKMCRRNAGLPGVRFFHPRWTSLIKAMRRADADIYYYNCGDLGLGQVVLYARRHNRKVVYSVASDPDCMDSLPSLNSLRERILYRYGLLRADKVIVQTQKQRRMLKEGFGIEAIKIPMPCAGFSTTNELHTKPTLPKSPRILWVGRISPEKRPEFFLDLAERFPNMIFDLVGSANVRTAYAEKILARARSLSNVIIHGRVIHDEMERFYRQASVLCCTSSFEGFPNTFLEAWSVGVPVITIFDPDDIIATKGIGRVAGTVGKLAQALQDLITSPSEWRRASEAARSYFNENHTLQATMPLFDRIFRQLLEISFQR